MTTKYTANQQSFYDRHYLKWIESTVEKLRTGDYANIEWENLIEEIEDLGRSKRRSLEDNLIIVLLHLLKWQYQANMRSGSWKGSIVEYRQLIRKALKDSSSLKAYLEEVFGECYADAVEGAIAETRLSLETFPQSCPYTSTEVLDSGFFPGDSDIVSAE